VEDGPAGKEAPSSTASELVDGPRAPVAVASEDTSSLPPPPSLHAGFPPPATAERPAKKLQPSDDATSAAPLSASIAKGQTTAAEVTPSDRDEPAKTQQTDKPVDASPSAVKAAVPAVPKADIKPAISSVAPTTTSGPMTWSQKQAALKAAAAAGGGGGSSAPPAPAPAPAAAPAAASAAPLTWSQKQAALKAAAASNSGNAPASSSAAKAAPWSKPATSEPSAGASAAAAKAPSKWGKPGEPASAAASGGSGTGGAKAPWASKAAGGAGATPSASAPAGPKAAALPAAEAVPSVLEPFDVETKQGKAAAIAAVVGAEAGYSPRADDALPPVVRATSEVRVFDLGPTPLPPPVSLSDPLEPPSIVQSGSSGTEKTAAPLGRAAVDAAAPSAFVPRLEATAAPSSTSDASLDVSAPIKPQTLPGAPSGDVEAGLSSGPVTPRSAAPVPPSGHLPLEFLVSCHSSISMPRGG
jgi:hypothetical protein